MVTVIIVCIITQFHSRIPIGLMVFNVFKYIIGESSEVHPYYTHIHGRTHTLIIRALSMRHALHSSSDAHVYTYTAHVESQNRL